MLKVKLQPELATFKPGDKTPIPMGFEKPQKVWQNNSFRLDIEGQGNINTDHVTKIEALTIGVSAKAVQRGSFLLPEYMPGQIKMPKLSIHVPLHHAGTLIDWFQRVADKPSSADGAGYEATGGLTFLDTTTSKDLYTINFEGLAPEQMSIVKSEGGSSTLKTAKFDFYVTNLKLNP
jgi:hypothetical protein